MMEAKPVLFVQSDEEPAKRTGDFPITVIAVYEGKAPLTVSMKRVFKGNPPFGFPTEITEGVNKTRIVYNLTLDQWRQLLETGVTPFAHISIRQLMIPLLKYFQTRYSGFFSAIAFDEDTDPDIYADLKAIR